MKLNEAWDELHALNIPPKVANRLLKDQPEEGMAETYAGEQLQDAIKTILTDRQARIGEADSAWVMCILCGNKVWDEDEHPYQDGFIGEECGCWDEHAVECKFCGKKVNDLTAHQHEDDWVGDECGCWDERLRVSA